MPSTTVHISRRVDVCHFDEFNPIWLKIWMNKITISPLNNLKYKPLESSKSYYCRVKWLSVCVSRAMPCSRSPSRSLFLALSVSHNTKPCSERHRTSPFRLNRNNKLKVDRLIRQRPIQCAHTQTHPAAMRFAYDVVCRMACQRILI